MASAIRRAPSIPPIVAAVMASELTVTTIRIGGRFLGHGRLGFAPNSFPCSPDLRLMPCHAGSARSGQGRRYPGRFGNWVADKQSLARVLGRPGVWLEPRPGRARTSKWY